MQRLFEWIKFFIKEKINIFYKGFWGGGIISGIFLFGSNFSSTTIFIYAYLIKLLAVVITGLISGFTTVLGNDLYQWMKSKIIDHKKETKKRPKRRAA